MSSTTSTHRRRIGAALALSVAASLAPLAGALAPAAAASPCTAPGGLSPDSGYRTSAPDIKDVTLSWAPVSDATAYEVQVGLDEDFASNVLATYPTSSTSVDVPVGSLGDRSFFWRVRVAGARCWSDGGATHAASVTKGWAAAPTPLPGCADAALARSALRFCWSPVPEAAYYRVDVADTSDGSIGHCYTNQTQLTPSYLFTPEADEGAILNGPERTTQTRCFNTAFLAEGDSYAWTVQAIDQGASLSVDGKPYGGDTRITGSQPPFAPKDAPPTGAVTVTKVSPSTGSVAGGYRVTVAGSGFAAGSTSVAVAGISVDKDHVAVDSPTQIHFTMPPKLAAGASDLIVTEEVSGETSTASLVSTFTAGSVTDTFVSSELSRTSSPVSFSLTPTAVSPGLAPAPTGLTAKAPAADGQLTLDCTATSVATATDCPTTPVIQWTPVAAASEYRVTFSVNGPSGPRYVLRSYDTHSASLAVRDLLLPDQAGDGYSVTVQSCKPSSCSGGVSAPVFFRTRSTPVQLGSPAQGSSTAAPSIVLTWSPYLATNGTVLDAARYRVQVATDCAFSQVVTAGDVDFTHYAPSDFAYPDGTYYWRVQAIDASGSTLAPGSAGNRDATVAGADCGDTRRFTVSRAPATTLPPTGGSGGATGGTPASTVASEALAVHYGQQVVGLSAAALRLTETSTGRSVPFAFTPLSDGGAASPALRDLVAGETYQLSVTGRVTDTRGTVLASPTVPAYRAPTRIDAPGAFVTLKGPWASRSARGALNKVSVVANGKKRQSMSMRFRGSAVTVGYCAGPLNGKIAVYLDGKVVKNLSTYSPFTRCGLPGAAKAPHTTLKVSDVSRQHTVTVVATGVRGLRHGKQVSIDWFDVA